MKRCNFDLERLKSAKELKINENFIPCSVNEGDELFPNGIFVFNITKMIEYLKNYPHEIELIEVAVTDFPSSFSSVDESHVDSVDVSRPVILAEISPGRYNLIDGNHRLEKARKMGISNILAYKLHVKQHMEFLTERKAYMSYVEYWNNKLK